jgi:argininosuccinate lyase
MQQLTHSRGKLLDLASQHVETVVPTFTHGVPAQPTTFGHYLLAYGGALERSQERLSQSYRRLNTSPYGVAVGTTSSFPLDRHALASMLAFDSIVVNSFDANHIAPIDLMQDVVAPLTTLALEIGMLTQDMTTYQSTAYPWLTTAAPGFTGVSSTMPQKRNPRILEYMRETASEIVASSHMATIMAHNGTFGLVDVRETWQRLPLRSTIDLLQLFDALMDSVRIDAERALCQVSHDYSTVTELVDVLFITCRVPFRTGHEFASKLVDYGRSQRMGTTEIDYLKASTIYHEIAGEEFPMTEDQFLDSLNPTCLVQR